MRHPWAWPDSGFPGLRNPWNSDPLPFHVQLDPPGFAG